MLSALYAIVRPSVRHTGASVKIGCSCNFQHTVARVYFCKVGLNFIQKFWRAPPGVGVKQRRVG